MEYAELLKRLTEDCKDDGKQFRKKDRIHEIKALLENSGYELLGEGSLSLLYGKPMEEENTYRTLVSSHVDCVYKNCFAKDEDELCWKGTFDNSATNAAVIDLMLRGELDESVLVAFTGDEEKDSAGAIEIMQMLGRMECLVGKALVLDVTNEGWEDEAAFSIENDHGFDIITGYHIVEVIPRLRRGSHDGKATRVQPLNYYRPAQVYLAAEANRILLARATDLAPAV